MSINNYSTDLFVYTLNGRVLTDWGESDPPFSSDPIDPKSTLRRGLGGNAVRLDRINPGRQHTINLNPGSPDSAYVRGLVNSGANLTATYVQVGTLEGEVCTEGVCVNDGAKGRAGQTITDDQYIFEFNTFSDTSGGE